MIILGLESSAVSAGAAVVKDGKLIGESYVNIGLTHSETLLPLTDRCLKSAGLSVSDVDAFAVAQGPGSFTGIRIGISAVKGLAFDTGKPVYGISTLEAMACGAMLEEYVICPVMDARCRQVYTALFETSGGALVRKTEDMPLKLEELEALLQKQERKILLIGDGAQITCAYLAASGTVDFCVFPEIFKYQRAAGVAFAAYVRYNNGEEGQPGETLQPSYLRLPQAERERNKGEQKK